MDEQKSKRQFRVTSSLKQAITMIIIVVVFMLVITYVTIPIRVNGDSMMNTLYDGDITLMNGLVVNEKSIHRFDVVVVKMEDFPLLIKRVIGLPGETITYKNDVLYVNGEVVEENFFDQDFVSSQMALHSRQVYTNDFTVTLEDDEYFVLGDNRIDSADSRILGAFKIDQIRSRKGLVIYPFDHARVID
ncbi:MAG: signal peptidase I [Erysipelotrichaceae bacterium]|nr:signal peptidase I [Erysipelotrichaceae bacterium]